MTTGVLGEKDLPEYSVPWHRVGLKDIRYIVKKDFMPELSEVVRALLLLCHKLSLCSAYCTLYAYASWSQTWYFWENLSNGMHTCTIISDSISKKKYSLSHVKVKECYLFCFDCHLLFLLPFQLSAICSDILCLPALHM